MKKRLLSLFLLMSLCLLFLTACGSQSQPVKKGEKLHVVATTTMLTDLVSQIGGDDVTVTGLMGPGVDPHLYQAGAGDVTTLSGADLIVCNGLHLEGKMGDVLKNVENKGISTVYVADSLPAESILTFENEGAAAQDPHIWFDVENWKKAATAVEKALAEKDPEHAARYKERAQTYLHQLDETNEYVKKRSAEIPENSRILVTAHDAFQYFSRAYGFQVRGLQGVSTASEAGTRDMADLVQFITDHKIKAIFVESSVPHKTIEAVQEACRAKGWNVVVGGELYSDSLDTTTHPAGTYSGMIKANIDTIVDALK